MKILQINASINSGSTGRIAEDIGSVLIDNGHESYIAYGRNNRESRSTKIKIGNQLNVIIHYFESLLFDRHGFSSRIATYFFLRKIAKINPDVIGLHNIHGYYINIEMLFNYIKKKNIPVVWTLFDCWAFTGHCSYFDNINCQKWTFQCEKCPKRKFYPKSLFIDNSKKNYIQKRNMFNGVKNLQIIVHSEWLNNITKKSFLSSYSTKLINSGVDLNIFKPTDSEWKTSMNLKNKRIVLGCASIWDIRKGLNDFIQLAELLDENYQLVLVGLNKDQIKLIRNKIIGISRTENVHKLAELYSIADVFVNPTYLDNFPTTNLEALACGTPVVTYNTGGSPEAIDNETGIVVQQGNIIELKNAIESIMKNDKQDLSIKCRRRAERFFDKQIKFKEYMAVFNEIANK